MSTLTWTESLELKQPVMDDTHREFVEHLMALEAALDAELGTAALAERYAELLAHTEHHFAQEDSWMAAVGFSAENCHAMQHAQLLHALRQVPAMIDQGPATPLLRTLVQELAAWFPAHAQMMDAALAEVMQQRGFDPASGRFAVPAAPDAAPITGCGGARCG